MKRQIKWMSSLVFLIIMCIGVSGQMAWAEVTFSDVQGHWAQDTIDKWGADGRAGGYPDGTFRPNSNITKAEFITLVNQIFGFTSDELGNYSDVSSGSWYQEETAIAKTNRYMTWYEAKNLEPNTYITRNDASVILAEIITTRILNADEVLSRFSDFTSIENQYKEQIATLVDLGFLSGYPDGTFKSNEPITRAESLIILDDVLGKTVTESGTIGNVGDQEVIETNMTIYKGNTNLINLHIKGDLILTAGIGQGDINLENVIVDGRIIIDGGDNKISIKKGSASGVYLLKQSGETQLVAEDISIPNVVSRSNASLDGDFSETEVTIQSSGHEVQMSGTFGTVKVDGATTIDLQDNTVINQVTILENGGGSSVHTSEGSIIKTATFDGPADVDGLVAIDTVILNVDDVTIEPPVGKIEKGTDVQNDTGVRTSEDLQSLDDTSPQGPQVDVTAPRGYAVSIDQDKLNTANVSTMSFTFSGAELGATYDYSIDDTNGTTTPITGSGRIVTANDQITGIDLTSLDDDTLTLSVSLTDSNSNQGALVTDTVVKDMTPPSGYSAVFSLSYPSIQNLTNISFRIVSDDVGAIYHYSIDDANNATPPLTGTGNVESTTHYVRGLDLTSLDEGTLTLTAYLTDANGQGSDVSDTIIKDTLIPSGYTLSFSDNVTQSSGQLYMRFSVIDYEIGTTGYYIMDDSNSSTPRISGSFSANSTNVSFSKDVTNFDDGLISLKVYLTDRSGNVGNTVTATATKDTTAPSGYSVSWDSIHVNNTNETTQSFTFAGAEVGTTYYYTIDDTNNLTGAITGSGTITSVSDQINGIDVSGLDDDTLTLSVYLKDSKNHIGSSVTDTIIKETIAPSGYSASIDQIRISSSNESTMSFTFASAEVGTTFNYSVEDTNGATMAVTGTGSIATASDQITGIDVSGLDDDTLTLTVYLKDSNGNQGANVTDTVLKDSTGPSGYIVSFDQLAVMASNDNNIGFTFAGAEVGTRFNYSIDDTNNSTSPVTGSGTIVTSSDQLSGIDVSGLDDGTLTLTAVLTDTNGNVGSAVTDTVVKDTLVPSGYSVDFDQSVIKASNKTNASFTFTSAEVGATYTFSIDDTQGATPAVTGSGLIASATDQISSIDLTSLDDGTLTLTVYLTDASGNQGMSVTDTISKDATGPSGYTLSFDQTTVNSVNETSVSFTFATAEVGTTYHYSIDDTNGSTSAITGTGTIATATDQISSIDLSGLDDDTLTLSVYLTDTNGNQGGSVTDTITKDTLSPSGYTVSLDQTLINKVNENSMSFTFSGAELGTTYHYSLDDTNGSTSAITGSGVIAAATDQITSINVTSLEDDTLTLTVYLTDAAGNQGGNSTDTIIKESTPPTGYSVSLDQAIITSTNKAAMTFTFASAEVGSTYTYSVDDTNGATSAVTGSGTIATATDQITGIDVSGLDDDTLTLTVYLTDLNGNKGANVTDTITKDTTPPAFNTGYPSVTNLIGNGFTLNCNVNESGKAYYMVVPSGSPEPSFIEVRTGSYMLPGPIVISGSYSVSANATTYQTILGLSVGVLYDVYIVLEDSNSIIQDSVTKVTSYTVPSSLTVAFTGPAAPYLENGLYSKTFDNYNSTGRPKYFYDLGGITFSIYWDSTISKWIIEDDWGDNIFESSALDVIPPTSGWVSRPEYYGGSTTMTISY